MLAFFCKVVMDFHVLKSGKGWCVTANMSLLFMLQYFA